MAIGWCVFPQPSGTTMLGAFCLGVWRQKSRNHQGNTLCMPLRYWDMVTYPSIPPSCPTTVERISGLETRGSVIVCKPLPFYMGLFLLRGGSKYGVLFLAYANPKQGRSRKNTHTVIVNCFLIGFRDGSSVRLQVRVHVLGSFGVANIG